MSSSNVVAVHNNTDEWIKENQQFFLPPVCNKMMHNDGQLKLFYVGGPNQRKDYHIEAGEELFYMLKGDMLLKVVEHGKHRDIPIKEGQLFLLPGKVAHSPQRFADTIGMVIERDRDADELDGLRYYVEKDRQATTESLYEEWFHCTDLGQQLAPVIKRFFSSEQFKTGKPIPGTIPERPPIVLNSKVSIEDPFDLMPWIKENRNKLDADGFIQIWGKPYQFQVTAYGQGITTSKCDTAETFILQLEGSSTVKTKGKDYEMKTNDSLLIPQGQEYTTDRPQGSVTLVAFQDPSRKHLMEDQ